MTTNMQRRAYQALDREWQPKFAAASDEITFNERAVRAHRRRPRVAADATLAAEQQRLTERVLRRLRARAAPSSMPRRRRSSGTSTRSSPALFSDFSAKVLADENTWTVLDREADLAGLPAVARRRATKAAADERGLPGKWAVVNTRSSVDPFLTFSTRRDLREKVWKAFKSRGDNGDANDTNATIARIVKLRAERATLLGFAYARALADGRHDGEDPKAAQDADDAGLAGGRRARQGGGRRHAGDRRQREALASRSSRGTTSTTPRRSARRSTTSTRTSSSRTSSSNNMIAGRVLDGRAALRHHVHARSPGTVPVFHPDVRVWEVTDKPTGAHVGLFYGDNFARAGKRSGAWASGYRGHETFTGDGARRSRRTTTTSSRAAPGEPVLISLDDAETLFHEFGHALHGLLSDVTLSRPRRRTPRDFVEYPSQVHEHGC